MFYISVLKLVASVCTKIVAKNYVGAIEDGVTLLSLVFDRVHPDHTGQAVAAMAPLYGLAAGRATPRKN